MNAVMRLKMSSLFLGRCVYQPQLHVNDIDIVLIYLLLVLQNLLARCKFTEFQTHLLLLGQLLQLLGLALHFLQLIIE